MFAPSCWLRPTGIVGHLPTPVGPLPDLDRTNPFAPLLDDWYETIAYAMAVTNAQFETQTIRTISGPFRVTHFRWQQSGADGRTVRIYLNFDDSDAEPTAALVQPARIPNSIAEDTTSPTPGVSSGINAGEAFPNQTFIGATTRLNVNIQNGSAATVSVWGHLTLCHLRPPTAAELARYA